MLFVQLRHDKLSPEKADVVEISKVNESEFAEACVMVTATLCPADGF